MKNRILAIVAAVCLLSVILITFLYVREDRSYRNLYQIYSNNFRRMEDELLTVNNDTMQLLEEVEESKRVDISDVLTIVNQLNLLDVLQKNYSSMLQEYYTSHGSEFKDVSNDYFDYRTGITFYHDISSYIDALRIEQAGTISNDEILLSENVIANGNTMISIMKNVSEFYSKYQEEEFKALSEKEKMHQRVTLQMEFSQKLAEINQMAADLMR